MLGLVLLFLLAGSIVLGLVRWLRGGSFLPEPEPGEDRHFLSKDGRWWREGPDGIIEEAFRKTPTPGEHPARLGEEPDTAARASVQTPSAGEHRHWWEDAREDAPEDAFAQAPNAAPLNKSLPQMLAVLAASHILGLVALVVAIIVPLAIIVAVASSISGFLGDIVPLWLPWVVGVICYAIVLRYGRRRQWF
jgi:hypothetical protein